MSQLTIAISICLAFYPTIIWFVQRTFDRSDEPWGLLSLATVIYLVLARPRISQVHPAEGRTDEKLQPLKPIAAVTGLCVLGLHLLTWTIAPPLVQAVLFVLTLGCFLITRLPVSSKEGLFGLLLLSLPIMPSVNFYAGYPVRAAVAAGARLLLCLLGLPALQEGTVLKIRDQFFAIDVPCSGIHMLWVEAYAVMLLAFIFGLNLKRTATLTSCACILIPIGNIFRASTLILFDLIHAQPALSTLSKFEPVVHTATGVFVFCVMTAAVGGLASYLSRLKNPRDAGLLNKNCKQTSTVDTDKPVRKIDFKKLFNGLSAGNLRRVQWSVVALCATTAILPFFAHPTTGAAISDPPPIWPTQIDSIRVTPVDSLKEEQAFASDFPGRMKRFTDGTNSYFVRCVYRDTRQLHPSSDCFRGLGYTIDSKPLIVGTDSKRWSSFIALKGTTRYLVMERIYNAQGGSWTDVSEWYWSSCLGKSKGPWFAVTIAKPQDPVTQP